MTKLKFLIALSVTCGLQGGPCIAGASVPLESISIRDTAASTKTSGLIAPEAPSSASSASPPAAITRERRGETELWDEFVRLGLVWPLLGLAVAVCLLLDLIFSSRATR